MHYNIRVHKSININLLLKSILKISLVNEYANETHLPASDLIEPDGFIRISLSKYDNTFYKPYILNISSSLIKVTFCFWF